MTNSITIKKNGPLIARGKIRVEDSDGNLITEEDEVFLCRCGASQNKPFCDGAHKDINFSDAAEINDDKLEKPEGNAGVVITVRPNAMLIAKGPMSIASSDGSSETTRNKAAFCRCGHSNNKPFCDASHKGIEF